jgi:hypothetical protein
VPISCFYWLFRHLLGLAVLRCRSDAANEVEILVLRHELAVLRRQVDRPSCRPADRVFLAALARALPRDRWGSVFVRPETVPPLAPVANRAPVDVSAPSAGQACNGRRCSCGDFAAGAGEPRLGLLPDPGRTRRARYPDRGQHRVVDPAAGRDRYSHGGRRRRGGSSCAHRRTGSSPATSLVSTPCCFGDCTCSCSARSRPGRCISRASPRTRPASGRPSRHATSSRRSSNLRSRSGS